jgi:hypothetical protein
MAGTRPLYFPSQPKRCADEGAGMGGTCLACGARPVHVCLAPVAERPKPPRRGRAA